MGKLGLRSVIIQTLVWGNHSNRNTAGLRVLHGHSHHGKYGLDANSRAVLAKLAFVWCVFKCYVWINRKFRQSLSAPDWVSRLWKRQRRDLRSCTKTLSRRTTDTGNRDAVVADSPRSGTITEVQAGPISCSKSPYMYVGHRLGNSSGPTSDMSSSQPSRLQGDYDAEHEIIELDYNPHSGPDALSMDDGRHIAHSLCERASPDHEHDISRPAFGSDTIFPLPPEWFRRWDRKASVEKITTNYILKAATRNFNERADPLGWTSVLHPEGSLYYYNETKRAVTDADLHDPACLNQIANVIATLETYIHDHDIPMPEEYTLALDLTKHSDGTFFTDYYYADHEKRLVFFLHDLQCSDLPVWSEVEGVSALSHIGHEIEAQYWHHGMMFSSTVKITTEHVADFRDLILHYIGAATTSIFSTSPYNLPDLDRMLSHAGSLKENVGMRHIGASSLLCRMMFILTRQKFLNWHGLPHARIHRNHSVYGNEHRPTALLKLISPVLFFAPNVHFVKLRELFVDGVAHQAASQKAFEELKEDWQDFILYATVQLNANVAFLAIQSVDNETVAYRSPIQIASYLSIVASIGSILLGLLLVRQPTTARGTISRVAEFMVHHPRYGLETHALIYSLPYALLLWAMISFLVAFAANCIINSSRATLGIMSASWALLAGLVACCVWARWSTSPTDDSQCTSDPAFQWLNLWTAPRRLVSKIKQRHERRHGVLGGHGQMPLP